MLRTALAHAPRGSPDAYDTSQQPEASLSKTWYYYTPAGGSESQIGDAGYAGLLTEAGVDTIRIATIPQATATEIVNLDNMSVLPEPATLVLLGLGLAFLKRRKS